MGKHFNEEKGVICLVSCIVHSRQLLVAMVGLNYWHQCSYTEVIELSAPPSTNQNWLFSVPFFAFCRTVHVIFPEIGSDRFNLCCIQSLQMDGLVALAILFQQDQSWCLVLFWGESNKYTPHWSLFASKLGSQPFYIVHLVLYQIQLTIPLFNTFCRCLHWGMSCFQCHGVFQCHSEWSILVWLITIPWTGY